MDTKNIINLIIQTTERLQEHYWQRVDQGDPKALSGVESCCEINLKLLAIITKPDIVLRVDEQSDGKQNNATISITQLTDQAINEIYDLLEQQKQEKTI